MTIDEYRKHIDRLNKTVGTDKNLYHVFSGLAAESGEVLSLLQKSLYKDKPIDVQLLKEELGDVFFYAFAILNHFNLSFEDIIESNISKLDARHSK